MIGAEAFAFAESCFQGQRPAPKPGPAVYPNPVVAGQLLTIAMGQPTTDLQVRLFDVQGRLLQSNHLQLGSSQQSFTLEVSDLSSGIYFLQLAADTWESSHRVCVLQ